jgi:hypothetical protein
MLELHGVGLKADATNIHGSVASWSLNSFGLDWISSRRVSAKAHRLSFTSVQDKKSVLLNSQCVVAGNANLPIGDLQKTPIGRLAFPGPRT